jgi:hypothetical protein
MIQKRLRNLNLSDIESLSSDEDEETPTRSTDAAAADDWGKPENMWQWRAHGIRLDTPPSGLILCGELIEPHLLFDDYNSESD